jgi:glutamate-1-semialdehyde 2,1-aminomutase
MSNIIINEQYENSKFYFDSGKGDKICINKKKLFDLSNCSGVLLFGHNSSIFRKTLNDFKKKNLTIFSHPNIYAKKLAEKVKYFFPHIHKLIFCNSGTESVIKSLRICRALNKKKIIVSVTGSWHGSVDQTLYLSDKKFAPIPLSSGLKKDDQKNLKFIPYNDIKTSKKILDKYKNDINSIIIEPVMGSLPVKNCKEYLKFLENYCKEKKIILIFDEIVSGFRFKNGSVQNQFNIKPDITLLGKVLGGGFPIGAIGITKKIKTEIDKLNKPIIFGGTFSANTFSVYSGLKTLDYIIKNEKVINELIKNCEFFQNKINQFIIKKKLDIRVFRFDNMMRLIFTKKEISNRIQRDFLEKKKNLNIIHFKKYLLKNKIYYPPSGIIFLSTFSTKKDLSLLIDIICKGLFKFFRKN